MRSPLKHHRLVPGCAGDGFVDVLAQLPQRRCPVSGLADHAIGQPAGVHAVSNAANGGGFVFGVESKSVIRRHCVNGAAHGGQGAAPAPPAGRLRRKPRRSASSGAKGVEHQQAPAPAPHTPSPALCWRARRRVASIIRLQRAFAADKQSAQVIAAIVFHQAPGSAAASPAPVTTVSSGHPVARTCRSAPP